MSDDFYSMAESLALMVGDASKMGEGG